MVIGIVALLLISCLVFVFLFFAYSLYQLNVCRSSVFLVLSTNSIRPVTLLSMTLLESLRAGSHQNALLESHIPCVSLAPSVTLLPLWSACGYQRIDNDIPNADHKCSASAGTKLHGTAVLQGLMWCRHYFLRGLMYFAAQWIGCQSILHFERTRIAQKHKSWCEQALTFKVVVMAFITLMHSPY